MNTSIPANVSVEALLTELSELQVAQSNAAISAISHKPSFVGSFT